MAYMKWRTFIFVVLLSCFCSFQALTEQTQQIPTIVSPSVVDPGEQVVFTVAGIIGGKDYQIHLMKREVESGLWVTAAEYDAPGSYSFEAEENGRYMVQVLAWDESGNIKNASRSIRVRSGNKTIMMVTDKTEVLTGTEYHINVEAPDADEMVIYIRYGTQSEQEYRRSESGYETIYGYATIGFETTHTYRVEARFKDEVISSEPLEIKIIAPYGKPDKVEIIAPKKIDTWEKAEIKIGSIPYVNNYQVMIYYADELIQSQVYHPEDFVDGYSPIMTLQGSQTQKQGFYRIAVSCFGIGTVFGYSSTYLQVGDINETVVFLPFQTDGKITEQIQYQAYAPFSSAYRIESIDESGEVNIHGFGDGALDRRSYLQWETPGRKIVTLYVYVNNKIIEKSAEVMITADGILETPKINVPYQIQEGESLAFQVPAIKNAKDMYIRIMRRSNKGTSQWVKSYEEPGDYILEAEVLKKGTYTIQVTAHASGFGYTYGSSVFHVGDINKNIMIGIEESEVQLNQQIELKYNIADADWARIICDTTGEEIVSAEDCQYSNWFSNWFSLTAEQAGIFVYTLEAKFGEEYIKQSVQVEVANSEKRLDSPNVQIPWIIPSGQDVVFQIDPVYGAEQYKIIVKRISDEVMVQNNRLSDINEPTIFADWLPLSGKCEVRVIAIGSGYIDSEPTVCIIEVGPKENPELDKMSTILLPNVLQRIDDEAFAGNSVERVIVPESLRIINDRAFANCKNLQYINLPDSLTYIAPDAFEGCDNLFIECSAGSLGEEFARAHGFYPVIK